MEDIEVWIEVVDVYVNNIYCGKQNFLFIHDKITGRMHHMELPEPKIGE